MAHKGVLLLEVIQMKDGVVQICMDGGVGWWMF